MRIPLPGQIQFAGMAGALQGANQAGAEAQANAAKQRSLDIEAAKAAAEDQARQQGLAFEKTKFEAEPGREAARIAAQAAAQQGLQTDRQKFEAGQGGLERASREGIAGAENQTRRDIASDSEDEARVRLGMTISADKTRQDASEAAAQALARLNAGLNNDNAQADFNRHLPNALRALGIDESRVNLERVRQSSDEAHRAEQEEFARKGIDIQNRSLNQRDHQAKAQRAMEAAAQWTPTMLQALKMVQENPLNPSWKGKDPYEVAKSIANDSLHQKIQAIQAMSGDYFSDSGLDAPSDSGEGGGGGIGGAGGPAGGGVPESPVLTRARSDFSHSPESQQRASASQHAMAADLAQAARAALDAKVGGLVPNARIVTPEPMSIEADGLSPEDRVAYMHWLSNQQKLRQGINYWEQ